MRPDTVDRLLLSRSLIAPLRFRPANDRFAVAAHILAAHDAAELAIATICTALSVANISDNRPPGLPDYLGRLKEFIHPDKEVAGRDYIGKLNRVRVDLKHHGITPDKEQWSNVAEIVFGYISVWCEEYLTVNYGALDAAELIRSERVRGIVRLARKLLESGHCQQCFETLAKALDSAPLELFPIGVHVPVGHADADTALALSAYGIDPGRYLALQRLMPRNGTLFAFEPYWEKRKYGHKGNWTQENAEFAYEETVNLLTRLQQANPYPTPYLYGDLFKDVLIVKKDKPKVKVLRWSFPDGWVLTNEQPQFVAGDRIECRAGGSMVDLCETPDPENANVDPEDSLQVVAKDVQHRNELTGDGMPPTLVFERSDVEITGELWDWATEEK